MASFYASNDRYTPEKSYTRAIEEGRLTPDDRALIVEYIAERQASFNISVNRAKKLTFDLIGWRRFITVPYRAATIGDIYIGVAGLKAGTSEKGRPFKQNTIHDYIQVLKPFLLWLIESEYSTLPEKKVRALKAPPIDHRTTGPDEILSIEDVTALMKACRSPRDRAFVSVLYESAGRIAEVGRLRWRDLLFDKWGVKAYIDDTKTGKRRYVRFTLSTMPLAAWRNAYPGTPEGDAPVFVGIARGAKEYTPMTYVAAKTVIDRAARRAGLTKRVHPHLFRKTRITHMITQNYQESVIKEAAWGNQDTGMLRTYIQLQENDMDREFLRRAGVEVEDEGNARRLEVTCARCHTINPPTNDCCGKCGLPLTMEGVGEVDQMMEDFFSLIATDPEKAVEFSKRWAERRKST